MKFVVLNISFPKNPIIMDEEMIPRLEDRIFTGYIPFPEVSEVILYPDPFHIKQIAGIDDSEIKAIVFVK